MKETVFLDGKFMPAQKAVIPVFEPGFLYGWGLFETMRFYNGNIIYLDGHLERIRDSCAGIGLKFPYSVNRAKDIINKAVKINNFRDSSVRFTLFKKVEPTGVLIIVKKYNPFPAATYKSGFSACVSALRQDEKSPLARIKTTNRILYQLSYADAKQRGFDEALILNNKNYIAEGSRANIFLVKDKRIFTPGLKCGCLPGITRRVIFDLVSQAGLRVKEGDFGIKDFKNADEAFLTSSLIGVMPLVSVEGRNISGGRPGGTTLFLMDKYKHLLEGN